MNYSKSLENLEKLGIDTNGYTLIVDKDKIKALEKNLELDIGLPANIISKFSEDVLIEDQSRYENLGVLPKNIIRKNLIITNQEVIDEIKEKRETSLNSNPKNVVLKNDSVEGENTTIYEFTDKFAFYKKVYSFYNVIPLTDEEISISVDILNAESLQSISSTLGFFKTVLIVYFVFLLLFTVLALGL